MENVNVRLSLCVAVMRGDLQTVKHIVVKEEWDINEIVSPAHKWTALAVTAKFGHCNIAELLLDHGADVNAHSDNEGNTPLHLACAWGHCDVARLLLEKGTDVTNRNNDGCSPLDLVLDLPPDDPAREEFISLFREYAPEMVMEAFCNATPTGREP